jgi:F-type H+-transporting ATPase subunit delta
MSEWKVARRYALAVFHLALEKGDLEKVISDMRLIRASIAGSPELAGMLRNPVLPPTAHHRILSAIFKDKLGKSVAVLLTFLREKRRLMILKEITDAFDELDKERQGIVEGTLFTARPVQEERKAALENGLSKKYTRTYRLVTETRPELIGGFSLMVRDRIYDCSIANQLKRLQEKLVGAS